MDNTTTESGAEEQDLGNVPNEELETFIAARVTRFISDTISVDDLGPIKRLEAVPISFNPPFGHPPTIIIAIELIDSNTNPDNRFRCEVRARAIDRDSAVIELRNSGSSNIGTLRVRWTAFGD